MDHTEEWLDTAETARHVKESEYTVREWVKHGVIPAYRPGGKNLRFKKSDVDAAIRAMAVEPTKTQRGEK